MGFHVTLRGRRGYCFTFLPLVVVDVEEVVGVVEVVEDGEERGLEVVVVVEEVVVVDVEVDLEMIPLDTLSATDFVARPTPLATFSIWSQPAATKTKKTNEVSLRAFTACNFIQSPPSGIEKIA